VNVITGALAKQPGPQNIRVNALNPGMVETEGANVIEAIGADSSVKGGRTRNE
jgi:3-oxoacyl-[acyl-carrier protein] reductase